MSVRGLLLLGVYVPMAVGLTLLHATTAWVPYGVGLVLLVVFV